MSLYIPLEQQSPALPLLQKDKIKHEHDQCCLLISTVMKNPLEMVLSYIAIEGESYNVPMLL